MLEPISQWACSGEAFAAQWLALSLSLVSQVTSQLWTMCSSDCSAASRQCPVWLSETWSFIFWAHLSQLQLVLDKCAAVSLKRASFGCLDNIVLQACLSAGHGWGSQHLPFQLLDESAMYKHHRHCSLKHSNADLAESI